MSSINNNGFAAQPAIVQPAKPVVPVNGTDPYAEIQSLYLNMIKKYEDLSHEYSNLEGGFLALQKQNPAPSKEVLDQIQSKIEAVAKELTSIEFDSSNPPAPKGPVAESLYKELARAAEDHVNSPDLLPNDLQNMQSSDYAKALTSIGQGIDAANKGINGATQANDPLAQIKHFYSTELEGYNILDTKGFGDMLNQFEHWKTTPGLSPDQVTKVENEVKAIAAKLKAMDGEERQQFDSLMKAASGQAGISLQSILNNMKNSPFAKDLTALQSQVSGVEKEMTGVQPTPSNNLAAVKALYQKEMGSYNDEMKNIENLRQQYLAMVDEYNKLPADEKSAFAKRVGAISNQLTQAYSTLSGSMQQAQEFAGLYNDALKPGASAQQIASDLNKMKTSNFSKTVEGLSHTISTASEGIHILGNDIKTRSQIEVLYQKETKSFDAASKNVDGLKQRYLDLVNEYNSLPTQADKDKVAKQIGAISNQLTSAYAALDKAMQGETEFTKLYNAAKQPNVSSQDLANDLKKMQGSDFVKSVDGLSHTVSLLSQGIYTLKSQIDKIPSEQMAADQKDAAAALKEISADLANIMNPADHDRDVGMLNVAAKKLESSIEDLLANLSWKSPAASSKPAVEPNEATQSAHHKRPVAPSHKLHG